MCRFPRHLEGATRSLPKLATNEAARSGCRDAYQDGLNVAVNVNVYVRIG
jgi:hypothetical protein